MITVPVQIQYLVDEVAQIGALDGKYAKFENNVFVGYIPFEDAVQSYIDAGLRVPDEFVEIRGAVTDKIKALQALL